MWNQNHMRLFDICNCRERDEIREKIMFNIEEELKKLPSKPGVYLMHDEKDDIIYVGKAISLKNRVRQYFQASRNKGIYCDRFGAGGACTGMQSDQGAQTEV